MKIPLLLGIVVCAIATESVSMANDLPVIIPDSSWPVTNRGTGAYVHTRLKILDTAVRPNSAQSTVSSINTPTTLRSAYQLPSTGGTGAIAIVDAYNYPTALSDFNTFAKEYGLPQETSTKATASNSTFQVVYATGTAPQSGGSYIESWNLEEALDIEWAHAIAPGAKIYLVEAASASMNDLLTAVAVASKLTGVREVSMSWGGSESSNEASSYDPYFNSISVAFFAAGGDSSDQLEYPSASPNVVSVGGTTLNRNSTGALTSETCWNDTGCGISRYEARPTFQSVVSSEVGSHRGANDVAFDANPNTGVMVYDSTPLYGEEGWWIVGGTSLGTPAWAAVVNLAASETSPAAGSQAENTLLYGNIVNSGTYAATFRDITSGNDGRVTTTKGWDQPTGLGSPLGLTGK